MHPGRVRVNQPHRVQVLPDQVEDQVHPAAVDGRVLDPGHLPHPGLPRAGPHGQGQVAVRDHPDQRGPPDPEAGATRGGGGHPAGRTVRTGVQG